MDVDGNGVLDAATDGLMILRSMFGLTGTAVTTDALGPGAKRTTWEQIKPYLDAYRAGTAPPSCSFDVDGNGTQDALTDGLILLRAMLKLTGTAVTSGVIGNGATRTSWADI